MTAMEQQQQPKKKAPKKGDAPPLATPPLHAVPQPEMPPVAPGEPGFDWAAEYPGEPVYVYTVPDGTDSPTGWTVGLTKVSADRAPNPELVMEAFDAGGLAPIWLLLKAVSSPSAAVARRRLRPPEYNAMLRGWAKWAGVELSE